MRSYDASGRKAVSFAKHPGAGRARAVCYAADRNRRRQQGIDAGTRGFLTLAAVMMALGLLLLVAAPKSVLSQGVQLVKVDASILGKGYRVSKLTGRTVTNDKNEDIGKLDDVIVSQDRVLYAVLQVGGFLGFGSRLVAVPYSSLVIDDTGTKIQLPGATRDELKKLAEFKYPA
jgi:sporulation protein YlmC with PRC-barrel domain